ncbi:hypothetical protein [Methanolobus psychrotolerans]|uniref:hypothetical protein n=1 Tax=Methanolobus psychrotolerans TaxID=1874706 RepID=UPI00101AD3D3|nr:hypothetical protein [Methanolobus psychrotolerans]
MKCDSTLHGKYENHDPEYETIKITHGCPKDMRWDPKRFVLSMVCNHEGRPAECEIKLRYKKTIEINDIDYKIIEIKWNLKVPLQH